MEQQLPQLVCAVPESTSNAVVQGRPTPSTEYIEATTRVTKIVSRIIADSDPLARKLNRAGPPPPPTAKPTRPAVTPSWFAGYLEPLPDPSKDPELLTLGPEQRKAKIRKYRQSQNKQWGIYLAQEAWLYWRTHDPKDILSTMSSPRTKQQTAEDELRIQKERARRIRDASIIPPADPDRARFYYEVTDQYPTRQEQDEWWFEQKKDLDEFIPSPRTQYFTMLDKKVLAEEMDKIRLRKLWVASRSRSRSQPQSQSHSPSSRSSSPPSPVTEADAQLSRSPSPASSSDQDPGSPSTLASSVSDLTCRTVEEWNGLC